MLNRLNILYFGDTHSAITGDKTTGLGGFDRIVTAIKKFREEHPNSLVLFGGDLYGQSIYSSEFKGELDTKLFNMIGIDAFSIGNHDFNHTISGLRQLIDWMPNTSFLSANINVDQEPSLAGKIKPYQIYTLGNQQVAVIGLLTEEVKNLAEKLKGKIQFYDLLESTKSNIAQAKNEGAEVIIVLSHLGFEKDQQLAKELVTENDVVILGNHTHTVLGNLPEVQFGPAKGKYPFVIEANGNQAFITAAAHHGQALGVIEIEHQANKIENCRGAPIIVDDKIRPDVNAAQLIQEYQAKLDPTLFNEIAKADVDLVGLDSFPYAKVLEGMLRREETPLGNFVADAILDLAQDYASHHFSHDMPVFSLTHAAGIRTDWKAGSITGENISNLFPYEQQLVIVHMTAKEIKQALEDSVTKADYQRRAEFLIGSKELSYHYDMNQEPGNRISELTLNGKPLENNKLYTIATNAYLFEMKINEKPTVFSNILPDVRIYLTENGKKLTDKSAGLAYCQKYKPTITGKLEGRITCAQGSLLDRYVTTGVKPEDRYIDAMGTLKSLCRLNGATNLNINSSLWTEENKGAHPSLMQPGPSTKLRRTH